MPTHHPSTFHHARNCGPRESLLAQSCVALGWGRMELFRRLQRAQSWVLRTLVSRHLGAGLRTPTRAFSSVRDCQGQCSVGSDGGKRRFRQLADVTTIAAVSRCRPTTRRKPDYEPVENTDEAQKKFGNVKAISSDMYFGRQAQADVSVWRASVWAPRAGSRQGPGRRASR